MLSTRTGSLYLCRRGVFEREIGRRPAGRAVGCAEAPQAGLPPLRAAIPDANRPSPDQQHLLIRSKAASHELGPGFIHEGHGWFDPLSPAKGDVFSLAEHLGADGFVEACDRVADMVGFLPSAPAWRRPARLKVPGSIAERWGNRLKPRSGSRVWRYLTDERGLPADIVKQVVACDRLREGPKGSMWAAHSDFAGALTGWEERGPAWRGFASDGAKDLFRFGAPGSERICITEAAIDAMSLAAIEVHRSDTLYVSTGGGWSRTTTLPTSPPPLWPVRTER